MATGTLLSAEQRARLAEIRDAAATIREALAELDADIGMIVDAALVVEDTVGELLNERGGWPPAKRPGPAA